MFCGRKVCGDTKVKGEQHVKVLSSNLNIFLLSFDLKKVNEMKKKSEIPPRTLCILPCSFDERLMCKGMMNTCSMY